MEDENIIDDATIENDEEDLDSILAEKWQEIESRGDDQTEAAQQAEVEQPAQVDHQETPAIKPPSSWKKELQEKFTTLAPEFQAEILRREDDFHKGIESYKQAADWTKQFEPIVDTIQSLRTEYGNEAKGIKYLHDLSQFADKDPIGFIREFAQSRGISLDGTNIHAQDNPIINQLKQQVEQLSGYVGSQQQQEQQRSIDEASKAIEAFKAKPEAAHFEALKADMAAILQAGLAESIEDAYDQALWRRKDLRDSEISKQVLERQKQAKEAAKKARGAASVNVKQRGHGASREADMPMEEFMQKKVAELGLG